MIADEEIQEKSPDEEESGEVAAASEQIVAKSQLPAESQVLSAPAIDDGATSKEEEATEGSDEDDEEEEEEEKSGRLPELDAVRATYPWYVVHTYSGYEMRAKLSLEERVRSLGLVQKFGHIVVPHETVEELVRGKKKQSTRKVFPGYILVQMSLDDETWHAVKDTPKVTGFVGDSRNPSPLTKSEVEDLLKQLEGGAQRPRPRVQFEEGDAIKVIDGPFADFNGTVDEVKADKGKLRVLISIFGRNTPVELDFVQVEKL